MKNPNFKKGDKFTISADELRLSGSNYPRVMTTGVEYEVVNAEESYSASDGGLIEFIGDDGQRHGIFGRRLTKVKGPSKYDGLAQRVENLEACDTANVMQINKVSQRVEDLVEGLVKYQAKTDGLEQRVSQRSTRNQERLDGFQAVQEAQGRYIVEAFERIRDLEKHLTNAQAQLQKLQPEPYTDPQVGARTVKLEITEGTLTAICSGLYRTIGGGVVDRLFELAKDQGVTIPFLDEHTVLTTNERVQELNGLHSFKDAAAGDRDYGLRSC